MKSIKNEEWRKNVPKIKPCEAHINKPHLQRLDYNPEYYTPNEKDLKVGDDIVIGTYASDLNGSPSIRWIETTVKGLPLFDYYSAYVTCKVKDIKFIRKEKLKYIYGLDTY